MTKFGKKQKQEAVTTAVTTPNKPANISGEVFALYETVKAHRRWLHRNPELSGQEFKTQGYICERLKELGIPFKKAGTGVIADIKGKNRKFKIALRADMDALKIEENGGAEYKSQNSGVMHACGHDGHMAMLLGAAELFTRVTPDADLRLIFQPSEESEGGAEGMIEAGALKNVKEIYALHMRPDIPMGKIGLAAGAVLAGVTEFDVEFYGKSAHCADREKGIDAVGAAVDFINGAYLLIKPYLSNNLFHVGAVSGGTVRNAVAVHAKAQCTLRYFDEAVRDEIMLKLENLLISVKETTGADHRVTVSAVYPPLINDAGAVNFALSKAGDMITDYPAKYTAEDFANYLLHVRGCMGWLGTYQGGEAETLHSDTFDFDELALMYGLEYYFRLLYGNDI